MQHLVMASMMVVSQTDKSDSQADDGRRRHEYQNEDERLIHLVQVQENGVAVFVHILQARMITRPKTDRRQAQANHGARRDDGSANCSHGMYLQTAQRILTVNALR